MALAPNRRNANSDEGEPGSDAAIVCVLGPIGVRKDGLLKSVQGQQGEVLALLAAAFPAGVATDSLTETLWGDSPPKTVGTGLRVVIHRLRDRLGSIDRIVSEHDGYRLALDPEQLDSECFAQLVGRAQAAFETNEHLRSGELLRSALEMWRGDAFQPFDTVGSLQPASTALNECRRDAEDLLLDTLLAAGRSDDAAAWASKLVAAAPYREQRWEGLALGLYRAGRQTEALRAIAEAVRLLRDDIGVEAGPGLRSLETDILEQSGALLLPGSSDSVDARSELIGTSESLPLVGQAARVGDPETSFLGRHDDVDAVARLLDSHRLVTVLGSAGCGKTRVAARVARSVSMRSYWIDLASLEGDQVDLALASQLGLSALARNRVDRIGRELRSEPTLVILDNCEHVLDAAAALAEAIVHSTVTTQVLCTSRVPLSSRNETCFVLPALTPEAAAELLRDRAFGVGSSPNLDPVVVDRLVRRLGANPLLIELVAEPVRMLSAESVAEQLELVLMRTDPDGSSDRHASLVAAIDWSVDLLHTTEAELHAALGVMRGGFTAQDVEEITGTQFAAIEEGLIDLCSHGLLTTDGGTNPTRYRQPEAIAIHARLRLNTGGKATATYEAHTTAHTDLVAQLAPALWTADEQRAVERLARVRDQLTATHERLVASGDVQRAANFALGMWDYSFLRLDIAQFEWIGDVLKLDGVEELTNYGDVLGTAAFAAWARNRFFESTQLADEAIRLAGDGPVPLNALRALFNVASFNEPDHGPMDAFGALIAATLERGAPHLQSDLQVMLALGLTQIGSADGAMRAAEQAIAIAEATSNPSCIAWATYGHGWVNLEIDPVEAARSFLTAARVARTVQNRFVEAMARGALVTSALRRGRPAQARGLLIDVIGMWNRLESTPQLIRACREAVLVLADQGDLRGARSALARVELLDLGHPLPPTDQLRFDKLARSLGVSDEPVGFDPADRLAESIVGLLRQ